MVAGKALGPVLSLAFFFFFLSKMEVISTFSVSYVEKSLMERPEGRK